MTGIFDSSRTNLGGPDLSGSTFVQQGVTMPGEPPIGYGNTLALAAQAAPQIRGGYITAQAEDDISAVQEEFLQNRGEVRGAKSELDALREQNPIEAGVADKAEKRIKELQGFLATGGMNPSEAQARIEAIKVRAINSAPNFAKQIRGLTGSSGAVFDAETSQLIKERNAIRDDMTSMFLDPDMPSDVSKYQQLKASERQAATLKAQTSITSDQASVLLGSEITQTIAKSQNAFKVAMSSVGGDPTKLPSDQRQAMIVELQQYTNGNEAFAVENALQRHLGARASLVDEPTRQRYASLIKANADMQIKQLDGSIPAGITDNNLNTLNDQFMLDLSQKNPGLYGTILLASKVPDGIAGLGVGEVASTEMSRYLRDLGLGRPTGITENTQGNVDGRQVQKATIASLNELSTKLGQLGSNADPETVEGVGTMYTNLSKAMADNPREYDISMYDGLVKTINDPNFEAMMASQAPEKQLEMAQEASRAFQIYARDKIAVDMREDLNVQAAPTGSLSEGATVGDLIDPVVKPDGTVVFEVRSDMRDPVNARQAAMWAAKLNKKYQNRSRLTVNAMAKVGKFGEDRKREASILLFAPAIRDAGAVLTDEPVQAQEESLTAMEAIKRLNKFRRSVQEKEGVKLTDEEAKERLTEEDDPLLFKTLNQQ